MNPVPGVIVLSVVGCLCMSVVVSLVHLRPFSFRFVSWGGSQIACTENKKGEEKARSLSLSLSLRGE